MRNGKNNVRVVRISNKMIKFMFHTNDLMFLLTVTLFFKHQIYTELCSKKLQHILLLRARVSLLRKINRRERGILFVKKVFFRFLTVVWCRKLSVSEQVNSQVLRNCRILSKFYL